MVYSKENERLKISHKKVNDKYVWKGKYLDPMDQYYDFQKKFILSEAHKHNIHID